MGLCWKNNTPSKCYTIVALGLSTLHLLALSNAVAEEVVEEIVVTGSYIKHLPEDAPTPVQVVDRVALEASGVTQIADIMGNLTVNTGAEFRNNPLVSNGMAGTANLNLRGLGLGSTLVLVNGKRLALSGQVSNDGSSFVDINQVPFSMIEAIEIQKDGGAATYGTDAIAGVVNFKTRKDFEGFEISGSNQSTLEDFQQDNEISMLWGSGNGRTHAVVAVSVMDRSDLDTTDRSNTITEFSESPLGNPGAFVVPAAGFGFETIIDPQCEEFGGIAFVSGSEGGTDLGTCGYQYGPFFELVAPESRTNIYATLSHEFNDQTEFYGELSYFKNHVNDLSASPSFPFGNFPAIPADHPGNIFDATAIFIGRVIGPTGRATRLDYFTESNRMVFGFKNESNSLAGWSWDAGASFGSYRRRSETVDTLVENFTNAINGLGGFNCDQETGTPGVGDCLYYNPFADGLNTNSQEVYDYMEGEAVDKSGTKLLVVDNVFSRDLDQWYLSGGVPAMALGWQYRKEEYNLSPDENLQNADTVFYFFGPTQRLEKDQDVVALFGELALPFWDNFEMQLALRYEDYGGDVGDSIDPKIAIRWDILDSLVLRSSASTTFRAPTLSQRYSSRTALEGVKQGDSTTFVSVIASGTEDLQPEEATTFNLGFIYNFFDSHSVSVDYWRVEYEDIIVKENPQELADAYFADGVSNLDKLDFSSSTGLIVGAQVNFVNAAEVLTDGVDFSWTWDIETMDIGGLQSKLMVTWVNTFDFTGTDGEEIDVLDNYNKNNPARPNQDLKFNWHLGWFKGQHGANFTWHYIDSYDTDMENLEQVDSHHTFDVQYAYSLVRVDASVSVGIINLTDEEPPEVETEFGYDSYTHDPRGIIGYVRGRYRF